MKKLLIACLLLIGLMGNAQTSNSPVNYGQPIELMCGGAPICGAMDATYTWTNRDGDWTYTDINADYVDPVILPTDGTGYKTDRFYLTINTGDVAYTSSVSVIVLYPGKKTPKIKPTEQWCY